MARERYKAIRHPLEYRNATAGVSPWRTAAKYVAPMVLAAAAFVSPLYFEVGQRPIKEELVVTLENGSQYLVRSSTIWYFFVFRIGKGERVSCKRSRRIRLSFETHSI